MEEIVGRDLKARMIRSVDHGEVKIAIEEERERRKRDSKKLRQTVEHLFYTGERGKYRRGTHKKQ